MKQCFKKLNNMLFIHIANSSHSDVIDLNFYTFLQNDVIDNIVYFTGTETEALISKQ